MVTEKERVRKEEKRMFITFLAFSFLIAWGVELALIFLYKINLMGGVPMQMIHFCAIGFGTGMAPAYAEFIVKKKDGVNLRSFIKGIASKAISFSDRYNHWWGNMEYLASAFMVCPQYFSKLI